MPVVVAPKYESWPLFYIHDYKKLLLTQEKKRDAFRLRVRQTTCKYAQYIVIPNNSQTQIKVYNNVYENHTVYASK